MADQGSETGTVAAAGRRSATLSKRSPRMNERAERRRILAKVMSMCPVTGSQDPAMTLAATEEYLADVPALAISWGCKRLVDRGQRFFPAGGEIRAEAMKWLRQATNDSGYNPRGNPSQTPGPRSEARLIAKFEEMLERMVEQKRLASGQRPRE